MMVKYIILMMASLSVAACAAHDEHYYSLHPKALEEAIAACPQQAPKGVSCDQLKNIASQVNDLAYQLRLNPQDYGKEILSLQEAIAKQKVTPNQPESASSLDEKMQQLAERLAVVKWLESPGGA